MNSQLTPQQKLELLRQMDSKVSLSFLMALNFFEENMNKLSEKKREEFSKIISEMNTEIKKLQLSVKNGEDGKDGRNGKDADDQKIIEEISRRIKQPKDGKNAIVNYDFIFDYILSRIKQPKDGKDGKDGSPDKPLEIATKLNTLTGKVDKKVIDGLEKWMEFIMTALREKKGGKSPASGGGMGNWIHEVFDVSSATTSVTLANNVAGQGNVIIVRYQGQVLDHDVHYTVSGKTVTNSGITFDDSTKLSVTYVRT